MDRQIQMIDYLPDFLQEYREIRYLMDAENAEMESFQKEQERTFASGFILDADEKGIKRFEEILGMFSAEGDSLEARRSRVLARWMESVPYTIKLLISKLEALCGPSGYSFAQEYDQYFFYLETHLGSAGEQDELTYLIRTLIPCNIRVESVNTLSTLSENRLYMAGTSGNALVYVMTNDFETETRSDHVAYIAGTSGNAMLYVMTNDYQTDINVEHGTYAGGTSGNAMVYMSTNDTAHDFSASHEIYQAGGHVISQQILITDKGDKDYAASMKQHAAGTTITIKEYKIGVDQNG